MFLAYRAHLQLSIACSVQLLELNLRTHVTTRNLAEPRDRQNDGSQITRVSLIREAAVCVSCDRYVAGY